MAVESGRSVERSRWAGSLTACRPCWAWLSNDVPTCRDLAVVWLKRGASASKVLELSMPATALPASGGGGHFHGGSDDRVDPHKGSHTAVAIGAGEEPLGELRVRASAVQAERLLAWAAAWPERTWAVEGAGGTGHLLAQQLLSAGERVLDVQPKLGARVRPSWLDSRPTTAELGGVRGSRRCARIARWRQGQRPWPRSVR
jgi:hypothetical protein